MTTAFPYCENSLFTELEWIRAHEDLMRFKKAKCRPSRALTQMGEDLLESSPEEKDLGVPAP